MRLRDLIGQDLATAVLRRAVAAGHVPHAYLFEGPPGVGKRSAAVGLGMALSCTVETGEGCGACEPCRRIAAGVHPDVITVTADGPLIVIKQVQDLVVLAQSRPHEAPVRVVIIDEADRLNLSAANCLLKTLEEPAPGTHIVLCTSSPDRILATIRSRTQRVRFRALPAADLVAIAVARGIARERAEVAAVLADGSVAGALAAASAEDGWDPWAAVAALQSAAQGSSVGALFDAATAAAGDKETKQELPRLLALLASLYRDALVSAAGARELALFGERVEALATRGVPALYRALGAVVEASADIGANTNAVTAVERMLLAIRRQERTVRTATTQTGARP